MNQAYFYNIRKLWLEWLNFTTSEHYDFFNSWASFWFMLSKYYLNWIQENPLEFQNICDNFINQYGKTANYESDKVQEIIIITLCTTKYVSTESWNLTQSYKSVIDSVSHDEIADSLSLFKKISNDCYIPFVNLYQNKRDRGIFDDVSQSSY